jgi:hypothetical protein
VREDLPGSLLAGGRLAAFGLAEGTVVARRGAAEVVAALGSGLRTPAPGQPPRVERLPGAFLWFF